MTNIVHARGALSDVRSRLLVLEVAPQLDSDLE